MENLMNKVNALKSSVDSLKDSVGGTTLTEMVDNVEDIKADEELFESMKVVGNASGTSINLTDSTDAPIQKMDVHGKNIFYIEGLPVKKDGITISKNENGDIVLNGKSTKTSGYTVFDFVYKNGCKMKKGVYTSSCNKMVGVGISFSLSPAVSNLNLIMAEKVSSKTYEFNSDFLLCYIMVNVSYDVEELTDYILNPQFEVGDLTPYQPYTKDVDVTVCGKNLFDTDKITDVYISDTVVRRGIIFKKLGLLTIKNSTMPTNIFYKTLEDGVYGSGNYLTDIPQTIDTNVSSLIIYAMSDNLLQNNKVQIESGNTIADYEPYEEQTTTIDTETQTGWENLKTYYPTTNIIPTQSATIDIDYIADTQLYIDKIKLDSAEAQVELQAQLDQATINS